MGMSQLISLLQEKVTSLSLCSRKNKLVSGQDRLFKELAAVMAKNPTTFKTDICIEDEMYLSLINIYGGDTQEACTEYFRTGRQMIDLVSQCVERYFDGYANISSFLEFACGYGRFTRYLLEELPADRIWGADIYADAVSFQKSTFGVNGLLSTKKPENFTSNRTYDFIFVASLFSHLPENTFRGWLHRLYELLAPGGILLFSVHDVDLIPAGHYMTNKGILFIEESESRSLDTCDYGYTYVNESFVSNVIREVTGENPKYFRGPRCLYHCQCVYVISNDPTKKLTDLALCPGPIGAVDGLNVHEANIIEFYGWATDFCKDCFVEILIVTNNGKKIGRCKPNFDRQDIVDGFNDESLRKSGWQCSVSLQKLQSDDRIVVKVINSSGIERVLKIVPVGSLTSCEPYEYQVNDQV